MDTRLSGDCLASPGAVHRPGRARPRQHLDPKTIAIQTEYQSLRDQVGGSVGAPALFVSTKGRLVVNTVDYVFADIVTTAASGCKATPPDQGPDGHWSMYTA